MISLSILMAGVKINVDNRLTITMQYNSNAQGSIPTVSFKSSQSRKQNKTRDTCSTQRFSEGKGSEWPDPEICSYSWTKFKAIATFLMRSQYYNSSSEDKLEAIRMNQLLTTEYSHSMDTANNLQAPPQKAGEEPAE